LQFFSLLLVEASQANQEDKANQANQANKRPNAKNLPCALATLVPLYKNLGLLECEIKNSQTIRHADSKKPKSRLQLYNDFFPELIQIQTHLQDFSLCEKHYNQLWQINSSDFDNEIVEKQARTQYAHKTNVVQTNEVGVQANPETHEIGIQVADIMLHTLETRVCFLQSQLDSKVIEVEDLKNRLEYAYDYVIESWGRVQEISKVNKELIELNNALKYKWKNRYDSQRKRIESVIQIANEERQNVYDDIESLIFNKEQFLFN
ncbi:9974_t:CDS:2, partial [Racocetra fulgida]